LLIDSTHAFNRAHIIGILGAQVPGMIRFDLTPGLLFLFFAF